MLVGERAAEPQERSGQEGDRGRAAFVWGFVTETQLYTLFYERPGSGPGELAPAVQ